MSEDDFTPFRTSATIEKGFRTRYDIPAWKGFLIDLFEYGIVPMLIIFGIVSLIVMTVLI